MPFLCAFFKRTDARPVDRTGLAKLLCPYEGELQSVDLRRGRLYTSSIAEVRDGVEVRGAEHARSPSTLCTIPKETRKTPQTSWLVITLDGDEVRFETDPLGTFPLWCFEDDAWLVITSEVKSVQALAGAKVLLKPDASFEVARRPPDFSPYRNVRRVFPGAVLTVSRDLRTTEHRRSPLVYRPASMLQSEAECKDLLESALLASAESIGSARDGGWGTFLSGGIDSSMATSLMKRAQPELATFTLGTKLGDEYVDAEELSSFLGARNTRVFATEEDAVAYFERAVFCNETTDGLTAETLAQLGILAKAASASVRSVVTGYGADLLFGSMLRHELYMKVTGVDDLQSLIERTCWTGEFCPFFAWSLGVELHHLFWAPDLMNVAFRIPEKANFDGTREKMVLRSLAEERGYMRHEHAYRRKQALTDGTQFNRVLSSAFALESPYAYDEKSARCVSRLRAVMGDGAGHHGGRTP
jgi:asparagine synthetase B (glutamine-hydrolysing)